MKNCQNNVLLIRNSKFWVLLCFPFFASEGSHAMGRGRQKAKQTKVARKLKYYSPETDYAKLERELNAKAHDCFDQDDVSDSLHGWEDYDSYENS